MQTAELLKKVRRIEIKTRRISNHLFSGEYHSSFKGRGMSFSEIRKYEPGDDVRDIDWNVTAKLNEPYIKIFEEERELTLMLMVDISASGHFGTHLQDKRETITEFCAVLAFSAMQNNDKVGVIFFSDQVEKYIPPKKGKSHVLRIIRELIEIEPVNKGTNISEAIKFQIGVMKKQCISFLISDFMDDNYLKNLRIAGRKYDLTGVRIFDRHEASIPNIGLVKMVDKESQEAFWVDTSSKKVRSNYQQWYDKHQAYFKDSFLKSGAGTIELRTDESYVKKLMEFFKHR